MKILLKRIFRQIFLEIRYLYKGEVKYLHKGRKQYKINAKLYESLNIIDSFKIYGKYRYPIYVDRYMDAGNLGQYFWQDLWAAKLISVNNPTTHYDIGSRIDGFIAHLASFRENIYLIDVRPLEEEITGVSFHQADATDLRNLDDNSIESVSALCSLEHFGLGRYGDKVDPESCFKAMKSIQRVLMRGGHAYISVPVGFEHVEFDAHRVFFASTIINTFDEMDCVEYSCIGENDKRIEYNVELHKYDSDKSLGAGRFGLFHFVKH